MADKIRDAQSQGDTKDLLEPMDDNERLKDSRNIVRKVEHASVSVTPESESARAATVSPSKEDIELCVDNCANAALVNANDALQMSAEPPKEQPPADKLDDTASTMRQIENAQKAAKPSAGIKLIKGAVNQLNGVKNTVKELKAANVPDDVIQMICRWMNPESLRAYARHGQSLHINSVDQAEHATIDAIQSASVPKVCNTEGNAALHLTFARSISARAQAVLDAYGIIGL